MSQDIKLYKEFQNMNNDEKEAYLRGRADEISRTTGLKSADIFQKAFNSMSNSESSDPEHIIREALLALK